MLRKVLILEDDIFKATDITRALEKYGEMEIHKVRNQQAGIEKIKDALENQEGYDLIITDMNYPLAAGEETDPEAGFKLIFTLKREKITVPIIICSSYHYQEPSILGCVWYHKSRDLFLDFKELLEKEFSK